MHLQEVALTALLLLTLHQLYKRYIAHLARTTAARTHGCVPAARYRHTLPFGFDLYRLRLSAIKAGCYDKFTLGLFHQYGKTFEEHLFGEVTINTYEIANFQAVAVFNFDDYVKPPSRKALDPFLGSGIFSQDGPQWKHSRDMVRPLFKRAEVADVRNFEKFADRLIEVLPRDGSTVNLAPLLLKVFLDSSTEFIFGESVDSLHKPSTEAQSFIDSFNHALAGGGKRRHAGQILSRLPFVFDSKTWKRHYTNVHDFVDRRVARALAATESDTAGKDFGSDPSAIDDNVTNKASRYILIDEMAKQIHDPIALRFQLLNVFFPARETTAIALSNTLFNLARHPSIWSDLREEALLLGDQPLTFELLKSLHLFRYSLFEGIRLQGPTGQIPRMALRDTVLPRGGGPNGAAPLFVPRGNIVALNTIPLYHDTTIWGPDAETFNPRRFLGKKHTWEFAPFFGGLRMCPAQQQVLTQGVYLLVRLVRAFERIENRDDTWNWVQATKMLSESRNGVKVALHPANDEN